MCNSVCFSIMMLHNVTYVHTCIPTYHTSHTPHIHTTHIHPPHPPQGWIPCHQSMMWQIHQVSSMTTVHQNSTDCSVCLSLWHHYWYPNTGCGCLCLSSGGALGLVCTMTHSTHPVFFGGGCGGGGTYISYTHAPTYTLVYPCIPMHIQAYRHTLTPTHTSPPYTHSQHTLVCP